MLGIKAPSVLDFILESSAPLSNRNGLAFRPIDPCRWDKMFLLPGATASCSLLFSHFAQAQGTLSLSHRVSPWKLMLSLFL